MIVRVFMNQSDLKTAPRRKFAVHFKQEMREIFGIIAAGAGEDGNNGVIFVIFTPGAAALELPLEFGMLAHRLGRSGFVLPEVRLLHLGFQHLNSLL